MADYEFSVKERENSRFELIETSNSRVFDACTYLNYKYQESQACNEA
jgi:hypothetical protein